MGERWKLRPLLLHRATDILSYNTAIGLCEMGVRGRLALLLLCEMWPCLMPTQTLSYNVAISAASHDGHWHRVPALLEARFDLMDQDASELRDEIVRGLLVRGQLGVKPRGRASGFFTSQIARPQQVVIQSHLAIVPNFDPENS